MVSVAACVFLASSSDGRLNAQSQGRSAPSNTAAADVPSTPENVVLGSFPIDRPPVVRVASGSTVRIATLSQRGALQEQDPVTFLGAYGVKPEEVLKDVRDVWASRASRPKEERGGHPLTGPV
jgi:hypothetical protein